MKLTMTSLAAAALIIACCPKQQPAETKKEAAPAAAEFTKENLKTNDDKLSYSYGMDIGANLLRTEIEVNYDALLKGIKDGSNKEATPLLEEKERQDIKREHAKARKEARDKEREEQAKKNKEEGDKFLAENKGKEGVTTLESGLQYQVLKEGSGNKPAATDTVSVNYVGTLLDGTEFDSSIKRGKPASFKVNRVVKGWTEALQLMPVGSKWKLFIPSDLGYGERGSYGKIGPNAVLIFEVELLAIEKEGDAAKPVKLEKAPPRPLKVEPAKPKADDTKKE